MAYTRDEAYKTLATFKPAKIFLECYRKRTLVEHLDVYLGPPEEFFIAPDTQVKYAASQLVPILDDGNFGQVLFAGPKAGELVQISIEGPDECRVWFRHWQQYLADLMLRIAESVDDDDRIRRMAEHVGFNHTAELFDYFRRIDGLKGNVWWEERCRFPHSIVERPQGSQPP